MKNFKKLGIGAAFGAVAGMTLAVLTYKTEGIVYPGMCLLCSIAWMFAYLKKS